jgi:MoaA/NifB/PqqE/SkfB family radical SAM enzyme
LKEWENVVDHSSKMALTYYHRGGEPFFRPDIRSLLAYIVKKKPAELVVLTNATL